jgi:hypothetical protein
MSAVNDANALSSWEANITVSSILMAAILDQVKVAPHLNPVAASLVSQRLSSR